MKNLYMLEKRLARLEKSLKLERTVGRGGAPSNAYLIWQFLMQNPNSTSAEIKNNFPAAKRASISSMIVDCTKEDCIRKNGDHYTANPDYAWDDVGAIPRTTAPTRPSLDDIQRDTVNNNVLEDNTDDVEETEPEQPVLSLHGKDGEDAIINIINSKNNKRAHSATIILNFPNERIHAVRAKLNNMVSKGLLNKDGSWYTVVQQETAVEPEPELVRQREATTRRRASSVVANIWSLKTDEIKAALDSGEDINQTNAKGETPLTKAIASKNPAALAAIEYLLNQGANVNVTMPNGMPLVYRAARSDNGPLVKVLVEHGADPNIRYKNQAAIEICTANGTLQNEYIRYVINADTLAKQPYNVFWNLIGICDKPYAAKILQEICDEYMPKIVADIRVRGMIPDLINRESNHSNGTIILKAALKNNYFPRFSYLLVGNFGTSMLNMIYDVAKNKSDQLIIDDVIQFNKAVSAVCDKLNKPKDFLANLMSIDILKNAGNLAEIAMYAVRNNDVNLLTKITKTGRKDIGSFEMLRYVAKENPERKVTALACKLMKELLIDHWDRDVIAKSNNEYLIEWFIDREDDNALELASINYASDTVKRILREHDIPTGDKLYSALQGKQNKENIRSQIRRLQYAITDDVFRTAQEIIRESPELLENDTVISIINDPKNDDSFTARDLRRLLAEKPVDKYDF